MSYSPMARVALLDRVEHIGTQSTAVFENPAPGIVKSRVTGKASIEEVEAMLKYEVRVAEQHVDGLWLFHNWTGLEGYTKGVRERLVRFNTQNNDRIYRTDLCVRSKIVAMGVSVASIVLRDIYVHRNLKSLEDGLIRAIEVRNA